MADLPPETAVRLEFAALDRLMPMHLALSSGGRINSAGPTLRHLASPSDLRGEDLFALFEVRRPGGITRMAHLTTRAGERLHLTFRPGQDPIALRGLAVPLAGGRGLLLNLSFGIGVADAVRTHGLTDADFAATDLAIELLYLAEAKAAVMGELRALNTRLDGARSVALEQALTDTLTGLRNRRALDSELSRLIHAGTPFGLLHIDLDHFKAVNDTLGHAAGDHVLAEVARLLTSETRAQDTVSRIGGDEFVVVLPECPGSTQMERIARRIISRLRRPILFQGQPCRIAGSIGMVLSSAHFPPDRDRLLAAADAALYASKRGGRGQANWATPGVGTTLAP